MLGTPKKIARPLARDQTDDETEKILASAMAFRNG
jgi:hypothetical protein